MSKGSEMSTASDGTEQSLSAALIQEHLQIDAGIEHFAQNLESVGNSTEVALDFAPLLTAFRALRRHIYLEEKFVFPSLHDPSLMMAIQVMYREHGRIWRLMVEVEALVGGPAASGWEGSFGAGQDSGDDAASLLARCRSLLAELDAHNAKEEPIIYPHTDADLTVSEREELHEFLASGKLPDGWVCSAVANPAPRFSLPVAKE